MRIGSIGSQYPCQSVWWNLSDHQHEIAIDDRQRHFLLSFPAAVNRLTLQLGLLVREHGKTVARENEHRDESVIDVADDVSRRLITESARPRAADSEAGILPWRTADGEMHLLDEVFFDLHIRDAFKRHFQVATG